MASKPSMLSKFIKLLLKMFEILFRKRSLTLSLIAVDRGKRGTT